MSAAAQLDYLNRKIVKGKLYIYFRSPLDGTLTPLPNDETSAEFRRAYALCLRGIKAERNGDTPKCGRPAGTPQRAVVALNSLAHAITVYKSSPAFKKLRASTQAQYLRSLDVLGVRLGAAKLADIDIDAVDLYSEELETDFGASVADRHVNMLSSIWQAVRKRSEFGIKGLPNPTVDAERRYDVQRAHRPWTPDVQARFMAAAPEHLKLAKLVLHFSAQRGGDAIAMRWEDYDGRGIVVRPQKDRSSAAEALPNYHLCPKPLRDALDAAPRVAATILVNAWGKPYANANILSNAIRRVLIETGDVQPGERSFVMHGLRKTAARDVASLGIGGRGIQAITGHRSEDMANYYAAEFDRRRVNAAAIAAWDAELERQQSEHRTRAAAASKLQRAQIKVVK